MLSGACGWLASALRGPRVPRCAVACRRFHASGSRRSADKSERTKEPPRAFDPALLEFLVCPLSRKPLRTLSGSTPPPGLGTVGSQNWSKAFRFLSQDDGEYEASTNELINEELGIAYPIIDGIPNMIPQAARMTHQSKKQEEKEQH